MNAPPVVLVSGYLTMDYVLHVDESADSTGHWQIVRRSSWPRPGGAVLYAGSRLAERGALTSAVTWVGSDQEGWRARQVLLRAGINTRGVETLEGRDTPVCIFVLQLGREPACMVDAGLSRDLSLSARQVTLARQADVLCIAAGPAAATAELLDNVPVTAQVVWIQKGDLQSFPQSLTRALFGRADLIFCNARERHLMMGDCANSRRQAIIETLGRDGVRIVRGEECVHLRCEPVNCEDAVGAGDTLAGETLGSLLCDGTSLEQAVVRGILAVGRLLESRVAASGGGEAVGVPS